MTEKISLEEFLGKRGLRDPISGYMQDKTIFPHGLTARQRKQLKKMHLNIQGNTTKKGLLPYGNITNWWKWQDHSQDKERDYNETARYGHPDNAATKAARRMCQKRGWKWEITVADMEEKFRQDGWKTLILQSFLLRAGENWLPDHFGSNVQWQKIFPYDCISQHISIRMANLYCLEEYEKSRRRNYESFIRIIYVLSWRRHRDLQ